MKKIDIEKVIFGFYRDSLIKNEFRGWDGFLYVF